jgi:small subunit ribosomal protein S12
MPTYSQFANGIRGIKSRKLRARWLLHHCQKKAVIVKLRTMTPRKPNSAIRKIAKVRIMSTGKKILACMTGKGHNLQQHSVVMLRGGRANDLPGVHYKMIRGKYDFVAREDFVRRRKRSRFSLKLPEDMRRDATIERKRLHEESVIEAKANNLPIPIYSRRALNFEVYSKHEKL